MNHTPGPWFADSSFVGSHSIDRFFIKCNSKDLPNGIAEAEANARLIAAAPELLAALKVCESVLRIQGYANAADIAQAAIAKATGA